MKTYPLLISLLFMVVSWVMGIYFLNIIYTSTIIVPLFNDFIWIRDYKGILGLTAIFSVITVPLIVFMYKKRNHLSKNKIWYSILIVTQLFWVGTLALQLKTIFYNLGICH